MKPMIGIIVVAFVLVVNAAIPEHKITSLPGLDTKLPFEMYSGYVTLSSGRSYFYWFVESARNPQSDPLVLWLNGGPGCSSLLGLLSENGPLIPGEAGQLVANPYSWNKLANMLYLESPAGVGFSTNPQGVQFNDSLTAADNYEFLQLWFVSYKEYSQHDFFITGESYAGKYIPELSLLIFKQTSKYPNQPPQSNYRGFMVGNPSTQDDIDFGPPLVTYYQTHGLLQLNDNTGNPSGDINPYDILVDTCDSSLLRNYIRFPHPYFNPKNKTKLAKIQKRDVPNPDPCIDNAITNYLNQVNVQKAIHAQPTQWQNCGGPDYSTDGTSMVPIYQTFLKNSPYNIMVYSGDEDTVINFISTQTWVLSLGLKETSPWAPWYYTHNTFLSKEESMARLRAPSRHVRASSQQVGGWGVSFGKFSYRTVKGAGHMVPWFQPAPALQMFHDYLQSAKK